jgi:hypothetical protein
MRISDAIPTLALLIAIASPAFLRAQFHDPTPEELKMTVDPKAPGASAVYLNIEEIDNDPNHYQSFYARIKVLQEKGKELATVEIPYWHSNFKIVDIKARTIHSDGTVIPLVGKPEDLLAFKSKDRNGESTQVNRKVFTLPSVEVGSILEYHYQLEYDDNHYSSPTWEVQKPYFVHKAHYLFTPYKAFLPGAQNVTSVFSFLTDERGRAVKNLLSWSKLPPGVTVIHDAGGHHSVDITDVPPIPDEESMPPIKSFLYKVEFYYKSEPNVTNFWSAEAKLWSKDVDRFAEPSKAIKNVVAGLVTPTDSELDKAKKLYIAVQALDNTDYSRKKTESELKQLKIKAAKNAQDTWEQKSGSSEDIALLYLAMLRAAGLNANALKVVNRDQGIFDPTYMTLYQLDDTIVLLNTGGSEIGLDPGEKMCPFKTLGWRHSLASGIRQGAGEKFMVTSPGQVYTDNKTVRTGDINLDAQGAITGTLRFVMTGQEAIRWRQTSLRNDLDEVKKQFDHSLESQVPEGVEAHLDHFLGLDDPYVNLVAVINVHGNLGSATSKRLLIPGFFFETRSSHPFVNQEKRLEPVDMRFDEQIGDQIVYHLPAGLTIEGTPQDSKVSWPQHAVYVAKVVTAPGQVTIARQLSRAFTLAKPEEYNDLRGFYQKVATADQQQLVLTTAPAAPKAN